MSFQNLATRSPELGSKRMCVSCSTRFYDMAKAPPVCPKCGTEQPPEVPRVRAPVREVRRRFPVPAPAVVVAEEVEVVADEELDEDAEIEPDDDDDDEDAAEIVKGTEEEP
jgi:hypothetical protein